MLAVPANELLMWGGPNYQRADALAAAVPDEGWQRLSAGEGAKGPRLSDWSLVELWRLQLTPEQRQWGHYLLVRRRVEKPDELAYYVVFCPRQQASLERVSRVAETRWNVEVCFESAKGECAWTSTRCKSGVLGTDMSRWRRAAGTCLPLRGTQHGESKGGSAEERIALTLPEVRRLLCRLLWVWRPAPRLVLAWSCWRRRHQLRAKRCHYRRRGATCPG